MIINPKHLFIVLILFAVTLAIIDAPKNYSLTRVGIPLELPFRTHLGLDLSGGTHITLEADMSDVDPVSRDEALESARQVIDRRVNFFGVSEPLVQTARSGSSYRIIVELPGITDVDSAVGLLGQTAKLEFREFLIEPEASESALIIPTMVTTKPVEITGKDLARASLTFSTETGEPEVAIEFTSEGAKKFDEVTTRMVGKHLPIFLDDVPLMWPTVRTPITDGKGVISGGFTSEAAKVLALQLNAGALPVPVSVIEKRAIGATLGAESVTKSIRAGSIGLIVVAVFMIFQYGRLGLIADMALVLYGLATYAIFRLIPVTLTLPGIAGFLLSIGMAVDSNILIFERFKEEKRSGKPWAIAMEMAFGKAWNSIRDANITTIITCLILYNPGNWQFLPTSGLVRGFAITLLIGVLVSLFTGVVATRTFIRVLFKEKNIHV